MIKRTITYTDYSGNERTEDYRFNLTESELTFMETTDEGGFQKRLKRIIAANDGPMIMKTFREILMASYGELSDDGRRFIKKKNGVRLCDEFEETEAYNIIFMEMCTDPEAASKFIAGILPKKEQMDKIVPSSNVVTMMPDA